MEWDQNNTDVVSYRARGVGEKFNDIVGLSKFTFPENAPYIHSVQELAQFLEDLGWPEPTDYTTTSFRWAVTIDGKVAQVGVWIGPEMEQVE